MTEAPTLSICDVDAAALRDACSILAPLAKIRGCLPALTSVRFNGRTVSATDLDVSVRIDLGADAVPAVLLPAVLLRDAAKALKPTARNPRSLTVSIGGGGVTLTGAGSRVAPEVAPIEEYPKVEEITDGVPVPVEVVAELLDVAWAASTDWSRPILTGVVWDGLQVAATDSYRLTVRDVVGAFSPDGGVLVPAVGLKYVAKVAAKFGPVRGGTIGDRAVTFRGARWAVTVRLIDGEFPNFRRLMRDEAETTGVVSLTPEAVAWIKATKIDPAPIRIELGDDGAVHLTYSDAAAGAGEYLNAGTWQPVDGASGFTFGLNPRFLVDQVAHDGARFHVIDHLKPVTFRHGDGYGLLMPIRLDLV
jgi:DNA polymerase III sliding clamp (beta) subunit (PCNA family)